MKISGRTNPWSMLTSLSFCLSSHNQTADLKDGIEQETIIRQRKVLIAHLGAEWEDQDLQLLLPC